MTTPLRVMTPHLAQLSPAEFHTQAIRWERTREQYYRSIGNIDRADSCAYLASRHERDLDSLLFS